MIIFLVYYSYCSLTTLGISNSAIARQQPTAYRHMTTVYIKPELYIIKCPLRSLTNKFPFFPYTDPLSQINPLFLVSLVRRFHVYLSCLHHFSFLSFLNAISSFSFYFCFLVTEFVSVFSHIVYIPVFTHRFYINVFSHILYISVFISCLF